MCPEKKIQATLKNCGLQSSPPPEGGGGGELTNSNRTTLKFHVHISSASLSTNNKIKVNKDFLYDYQVDVLRFTRKLH
jgi:hypothetical protein